MKPLFFLAMLLAVTGALRSETKTLAIDRAHSRLEVAVKATVDSFTATLSNYEAEIAVDPANGHVTGARFRFKFADLKTGKRARDEHMNTWQQTGDFPEVGFELAALTLLAEDRYVARGTLRLHGIAKEIEFPIALTTDRSLFSIDGEAALDTRDFNLPVIRKFAVLKVDPLVKVRFHLQGSCAGR